MLSVCSMVIDYRIVGFLWYRLKKQEFRSTSLFKKYKKINTHRACAKIFSEIFWWKGINDRIGYVKLKKSKKFRQNKG